VTIGTIRTFSSMDGDSHAFAALFEAHYAAVCRYVAARGVPDDPLREPRACCSPPPRTAWANSSAPHAGPRG
jgi:hypothetical protein